MSRRALGERSPTSRWPWTGCGPAGTATAACAVRTSPLSCSMRFPQPLCAWRASNPPIARPSRAAGARMAGFRRADGVRDLHTGGGDVEQARYQFCGGSLAGNDSRPQSSTMSLSREEVAAATPRSGSSRRRSQPRALVAGRGGSGWMCHRLSTLRFAQVAPAANTLSSRKASRRRTSRTRLGMFRWDVLTCSGASRRTTGWDGGVRLPREQSASAGGRIRTIMTYPALAVRG